jgi:uncharacterized membrane protein YphA (DoxX/SURF4 family)
VIAPAEDAAPESGSPRRTRFEQVAPWISTVVRLALGAVLLVAGGLKVIDPQTSVQAVKAYELLPAGLARLVGWGLPFVEIGIGLLLILGLLTRTAAIAAGALMVAFIAAVASAAARGLSIDCGCFGGGGAVAPGQTAYGAEIARDVGLLLAALWLAWQPRSRFALDHDEIEENDE